MKTSNDRVYVFEIYFTLFRKVISILQTRCRYVKYPKPQLRQKKLVINYQNFTQQRNNGEQKINNLVVRF